jgi:thymidylate synthase (FAD)
MKIIKPSYKIIAAPKGDESIKWIEEAARDCYQSQNKITEGSSETLFHHLSKGGHHAMIEFGGWIFVKFISNRGFSHEMVRHRLASFAQESTRYCNYSKGKFGNQVTFVETLDSLTLDKRIKTIDAWKQAEDNYLDLLKEGVQPQIAREVLPIGVKTVINVAANVREWKHIFGQRCSKKAHPRMRELMNPLLKELQERISVVFDDLGPEK